MAKKKKSEVVTPEPQKDASAKLAAIKIAMEQIEKQYGKGSIMRLGEAPGERFRVDVIPTGSIALDLALGVGGLPRGRIVEIYGPEASGKTTLALDIARNAAIKEKVPVQIFSIEMSREQVTDRLVAAEANVDLWKIRTGRLTDEGEPNELGPIVSQLGQLALTVVVQNPPVACPPPNLLHHLLSVIGHRRVPVPRPDVPQDHELAVFQERRREGRMFHLAVLQVAQHGRQALAGGFRASGHVLSACG